MKHLENVLFIALGFVLSMAGIKLTSWCFWAVMFIAAGISLSSFITGREYP